MRFYLSIACQSCRAMRQVPLHLNEDSFDWTCEACGNTNYGFFGLEFTIGYRILLRSEHEFRVVQDYSMSIALSATAFECELSRLFRKWTQIAALREGGLPEDSAIDEMLRKHRTIRDKIEEVGRLLDSRGIDEFARSSTALRNAIENDFPSLHLGSLAEDFQKTLFWPRNRILHTGHTKYEEADAVRCYNIARFGLHLLREMDIARRETV